MSSKLWLPMPFLSSLGMWTLKSEEVLLSSRTVDSFSRLYLLGLFVFSFLSLSAALLPGRCGLWASPSSWEVLALVEGGGGGGSASLSHTSVQVCLVPLRCTWFEFSSLTFQFPAGRSLSLQLLSLHLYFNGDSVEEGECFPGRCLHVKRHLFSSSLKGHLL